MNRETDLKSLAEAQVVGLMEYRRKRKKEACTKTVNTAAAMLMAAMCVTAGDLAEAIEDRYLSTGEADMLGCMITYTAAIFTTTHGRVERDLLRTFRVYEVEALRLGQLPQVLQYLQSWRD